MTLTKIAICGKLHQHSSQDLAAGSRLRWYPLGSVVKTWVVIGSAQYLLRLGVSYIGTFITTTLV